MADVLMHKCGKPGCRVQVPTTMLACRTHWYALPRDLRQTISAAYKAGDTVGHREAYLEAVGVWRSPVSDISVEERWAGT